MSFIFELKPTKNALRNETARDNTQNNDKSIERNHFGGP